MSAQFWVIDHHLEGRGEDEARRAWWDAAEQNRMSDTMLLDQLIDAGRRDAEPRRLQPRRDRQAYTRLDPGEPRHSPAVTARSAALRRPSQDGRSRSGTPSSSSRRTGGCSSRPSG